MKREQKTVGYLKLLLKTSLIVFLSVMIAKLLNYAYKVIIARVFGPEIYGLFSLSLVIVSFFIFLAGLGLFEGLVRYVSLYRGKKDDGKIRLIINFSLKVSLITSIISGLILFIFAEPISKQLFNNEGLIIFLKIFSIGIPFSIIANIYLGTLRAFEKITSYTLLINIVQNVIKVALLATLVFFGLKSNSVIFSYLISIIVLAIVSYLIGRGIIKKMKLAEIEDYKRKKLYMELFSYSWPLMLAGLTFNILYWCDSVIVGHYQDMAYVGYYSVAVTLVSLLAIVPDLFLQLFFPLIVRESSSDNKTLIKQLTKQVTKWIFIINFPLTLILIIFPGVIINLLFGADFLMAENALRILSISSLLASFSSMLNSILSMRGLSKTILYNFVVFAILNIILNLILVPKFGINGAAFATGSTWVLITLTQLFQIYRNMHFIPFRRKMFRIALVSFIPAMILLIISLKFLATMKVLILSGISFVVVYLALIIFTRCLDKYDLDVIKSLRNKLIKGYASIISD